MNSRKILLTIAAVVLLCAPAWSAIQAVDARIAEVERRIAALEEELRRLLVVDGFIDAVFFEQAEPGKNNETAATGEKSEDSRNDAGSELFSGIAFESAVGEREAHLARVDMERRRDARIQAGNLQVASGTAGAEQQWHLEQQRKAEASRALAEGVQSMQAGLAETARQHQQFQSRHNAAVAAQNERMRQAMQSQAARGQASSAWTNEQLRQAAAPYSGQSGSSAGWSSATPGTQRQAAGAATPAAAASGGVARAASGTQSGVAAGGRGAATEENNFWVVGRFVGHYKQLGGTSGKSWYFDRVTFRVVQQSSRPADSLDKRPDIAFYTRTMSGPLPYATANYQAREYQRSSRDGGDYLNMMKIFQDAVGR